MFVILLYVISGFSSLLASLSGNGVDIVGIAMLPVGVLLFLRKSEGVLGAKALGVLYTGIWVLSLVVGSFSESGTAQLSVFNFSISVAPAVAILLFGIFSLGQLYVAFIVAPVFFGSKSNS